MTPRHVVFGTVDAHLGTELSMVDATYELRVAGAVPEQDLRDLGAVTLAVDQVNTILYGIPDESALYGLLSRLRALGIEVVEVRRVPDAATLASTEEVAVEPGEVDDGTE